MLQFLGAVQFLTRVPIRLRTAPDVARGVPWYPVVGALVGAVVGAVAVGMFELVPPTVAAAVAVLFGVALTGAFHEDGLADTVDALGGWTPEQRRAILTDSRHGSYGVAAMCGSIVVRILTLATLSPGVAFAALVGAHTLGRTAALGNMLAVAPVADDDGLGAASVRRLSRFRVVAGMCVGVGIAALATGWWVGPIVAAVAVGAAVIAVLARRAFGGISGDLLGATEQVGEVLVLVVVSGLALRHPLWWS